MMNEKRLLENFLALVQIDSVTKNERVICDALKKKVEDLGMDVFEDDTAAVTGHGAGNLICFLKGNQPNAKTLLFNSHMDTVAPGNGVKPVIRDGYIYSDGTTILGADDKTGVAAILEMIQVLKEDNLPHGDIQVIFTVGEELGLIGASALDAKHLKADFGFALDTGGSVGKVKASAPTRYEIFADVYGTTAHAGVEPEKGVSAITIAAHAVANMPLGRLDDETTANIGTFDGHGPLNVVCDHVKIVAEARSGNMDKLENQVAAMRKALEDAATKFGGRVDVKAEMLYPSFSFTEDAPIIQLAQKAINQVGRSCEIIKAGGGSDANAFNGKGVPTIILAVGYENIHTVNERMPIAELGKITELALALVSEVTTTK